MRELTENMWDILSYLYDQSGNIGDIWNTSESIQKRLLSPSHLSRAIVSLIKRGFVKVEGVKEKRRIYAITEKGSKALETFCNGEKKNTDIDDPYISDHIKSAITNKKANRLDTPGQYVVTCMEGAVHSTLEAAQKAAEELARRQVGNKVGVFKLERVCFLKDIIWQKVG